MSEQKQNIHVGHLELSAKYVKPVIKEDKTKGYVLNGKNNDYFDYINDRRLGSPTHSAIVNNYIKLIHGLGLEDLRLNLIQRYISDENVKRLVDNFYNFGMAYIEVIKSVSGEFKRLEVINPKYVAPTIMDAKGKITSYVISKDFKDPYKNKVDYPAFGYGNGKENEIYCVRDYKYNDEYFALPTFQSVLQYAELEEEISNYALKHIKKGLAFGYIVNVPNSDSWTDEEKQQFKRQVINNLSGSDNAGAIVFDFNQSADGTNVNKITIDVVQQNDSHKAWESLREQARDNIIVGHEVVSPLLFGINRGAGLSSTAEEMEVAEEQTMIRVIKPYQETILKALERLFLNFGIVTNLRFIRLSEARTQLSKHPVHSLIDLGEVIDGDEWELIHKCEVDYDEDDKFHELLEKTELASTGTARPNAKSEQDNENIIVRYRYSGEKTNSKSRDFCIKMKQANKVYRKEDILQMENKPVNPGWGARGADTYSIWLYKGGGACRHYWRREIYLRKGINVDVRNPLVEKISVARAKARGLDVPKNDPKVGTKPKNMKNNGFLEPR